MKTQVYSILFLVLSSLISQSAFSQEFNESTALGTYQVTTLEGQNLMTLKLGRMGRGRRVVLEYPEYTLQGAWNLSGCFGALIIESIVDSNKTVQFEFDFTTFQINEVRNGVLSKYRGPETNNEFVNVHVIKLD